MFFDYRERKSRKMERQKNYRQRKQLYKAATADEVYG